MPKWSLNSDFSLIHNPSSVWSYGSKPAGYHVTGMFSLFTHLDPEPKCCSEIVAWFGSDNVWYTHGLGVYYNTKPTNILMGSVMFPANGIATHPSDDGRFSVIRFTAPKAGNYVIDATFTHIDTSASHTGVYIIYNNLITLWETGLAGPEDSKSFKTTDKGISVKADEPIDFIVGVGLDNVYYFDMTFTRVDIHLLDLLENQPGFPIITGSIGFVLGIIISAILFHIYYRYRENRRNANVGYQVIN
ncbi:uncharacterized protein OCT59_018500 [Rhizophagus irregularis]|uniref:Uncharacterized protein n=2 Tax=Rhizophagus irregularis TaxID=588596 RepID=A0A015KQX5_RHIIW|nr:hypothetical protein RirG_091240 [Rhizophagus irregularis DAOM 197198w]UZO26262.1 hypothetical protein OCT59_018500 [Rhizophagus irregularis]CAG8687722.1 4357_t:CDS:1 [Rhizophagus irregularis]